jgi:hypothetical protein
LFLGLLGGLGLGALAGIVQKSLGVRAWALPFDLFVGASFGLVAGWCLALQTLVVRLFRGLFGLFADRTPWLGDDRTSLWLSQMDSNFREAAERTGGFLRWILGRWMRRRLTKAGPFIDRVEQLGRRPPGRRQPGEPSAGTAGMAYRALSLLLEPIHRAFAAAYLLLLVAAVLFWALPFVTG